MSLLEQHIADVGSRFRHADRWRYSAWLLAMLTLTGAVLFYLQISRQWMHAAAGWWLLFTGAVGCLVVCGLVFWRYRDQGWLINQIEQSYPELDQRLWTAIGEIKKNDGRPLGYLQHTVLLETVAHAHHNGWSNLISHRSLQRLRTQGLFALGMVMAVSIGLMTFQPPASAFVARATENENAEADEQAALFDVIVEPGDTEIERGDDLIVVARFGKLTPKEVELVAVASDGTESRAKMKQSLDDPLFGSTIYDVAEPMEYYVSYGKADTERYKIGVFVLPEMVRSDAVLEYPEYTEQTRKVIEDTVRVTAVEGTDLSWKLRLNKPGIQATLIPRDEEAESIELQTDPGDPHTLVTALNLTESRRWTLKLVDADGRENRSPPILVAKVLPNKPAKLKLDLARDARVSPLEEFQVKATVSDDFGLQKFGVSYQLASADVTDVVLGESVDRNKKQSAEHMLDFEALDAEPDQLLSYYFWAEDRDGQGNERRTLSDMFFAEVRHFEEIFRQGQQLPGGQQQQQQQQQNQSPNAQDAEQLAEAQKQIINATWNVLRRGDDDTEKFKQDVSVILEGQQAVIEQAAELGNNLRDEESKQHLLRVQTFMQEALSQLTTAYSEPALETLSPALKPERGAYEALLKLRAREHEIVQQQQQRGQQRSQSASRQRLQQQIDQLQLQNDQNRYETERQAQEEQDTAETEMRRALNQLKELAQRQEDLNEQLKELQNALEQAETEEEREEIERQLKRLREQQEEMLRDTDELRERLQEIEDQESTQQAQEQLEQTREQMRETSERLEQGEVTPALASGTRAQRDLEEVREQLRRESANQFSEQLREMRDEAREIQEQQEEIGEQLQQEHASAQESTGLRQDEPEDRQDTQELEDALRQQRERLEQLLEEMKETVQEAEESEPLLADSLYDAFREAEKEQLSDKLEATARLTERGLTEQAEELEQDVREGLGSLREQIDQAAERVLGDQTEALRLAVETLEDLENQLRNEMEQFGESDDASDDEDREARTDPEQQASSSDRPEESGEPQEGRDQQSPNEQNSGERQPGEGQPQESDGQNQPSDQPSDQNQPGNQGNPQDAPRDSQAPNRPRSLRSPNQNSPQRDGGWGGAWDQPLTAPITGDDFREWSDQLRDVEEIVEDPELRAEAARIREQARDFRREYKRHSEEPKWNLVKELVSQPLRELRQNVSAELMRRAAEKNAVVPIDKDPVPKQFAEQVRRYYENLGIGE